ncbi:hypothetical protein KUTeg_016063 [Tegillarca granosa]|uniref:BTB domain-containing protein n=1 Tax=Tegillarca granosa TaxID=220873 RepID=A0ABQ9EQG7_TEGGR|nr:hypothetical protein KUTeg_016063 [Tegillarca granosa]
MEPKTDKYYCTLEIYSTVQENEERFRSIDGGLLLCLDSMEKTDRDHKPSKYQSPDYCSTFLRNIHSLWQDNRFCDVIIQVQDTTFHAHHLVLAAGCSYFKAMFTSGMIEDNTVVLQDISPNIFKCLLDFLYTGEIYITEENCQDLLSAADMFDMRDVVRLCSTFLKQQLHYQNCIVVKEEEFYEMPKETLISFLYSEHISIDDEYQVFVLAIDWILHDPLDRRKYIFDVMTPIRFPIISSQKIDKYLNDCKDISCKVAIQKYLQDFRLDRKKCLEQRLNKMKPYLLQPRKSARKNIFVVGGFERSKDGRWSDSRSLTSVEIFDTYNQHWKSLNGILYPRSSHGVAFLNGQVYVLGGEHDSLIYDTVEIYDTLTKKWNMGPPMNMPRCGLGVCVTNDCLYAVGGWVGMELGDTIEEFDPASETWRIIDKMKTPRFAAGVTEHEVVESFNPVTKEWQRLADMHNKRSYVGATSCNGYIYAVGGFNEVNGDLSCIERYCPEKDEWIELPPMSIKRSAPSVVTVNGLIFVIGGRHWIELYTSSAPVTLNSVECYDPSTGSWIEVSSMATSRAEAGAVVI